MKTKKLQKEYEEFIFEEMRKLTDEFSRVMLRCLNKLYELKNGNEKIL